MKILLAVLLLSVLASAQFVSTPVATTTPTTASVSFTTSSPCIAIFDFGLTTALGTNLTDMTAVSTHNFNLTGLAAATSYYDSIKCTDSLGDLVTSPGGTFKTAGSAPAATVSVTPAALSFPNATVGTTTAVQYVTLAASGTAPITISKGFTFTGTEFKFGGSGTCKVNQVLTTGQNCTAGVVFTPTATGTHSGTLTLNDNATANPQVVPLSGTIAGVTPPPAHSVTLNWTPSTSVTTSTLVLRNGALLATMPSTDTTYKDSTVVPGQTYTYDVEAETSGGLVSIPSNVVSAVIPTP